MYKIPRQSYTTEYKQEAARQVEVEGKSPAQAARDLGIAEQTLSNWRKAITPEQMELSRLRAENARLKMSLKSWKRPRRTSPSDCSEVRLDK